MHIVSGTLRGVLPLHLPPDLSKPARLRLKWFDWHDTHGRSVSLTCRHFGISRQTFYRWQRRFRTHALTTLEDHSHRPRRVRQPTWPAALALAVLQLRTENPRMGKEKLACLLAREGRTVSVSMVGRILTHLTHTSQLRETRGPGVTVLRRVTARPYAIRKPKGYPVTAPGDLVQVDTMDLRPLPGGGHPEAIYLPRCDLPLGCAPGGPDCHRRCRHPLLGGLSGPLTAADPGDSGGRRQRVYGGL